jgi:hypothetical protein
MVILRRGTGDLVCEYGTPEYDRILRDSQEVRGLVEDGKAWVHMGAVYECMRGVKVMMAAHFAGKSKYMWHAYAFMDDGDRYARITRFCLSLVDDGHSAA